MESPVVDSVSPVSQVVMNRRRFRDGSLQCWSWLRYLLLIEGPPAVEESLVVKGHFRFGTTSDPVVSEFWNNVFFTG